MVEPKTIQHNLLIHIARLYYLERLTHQEIGDRLGLSRIKITRLLQQAVDDKIVEFHIQEPDSESFDLEFKIARQFGLDKVIVVPEGENQTHLLQLLGRRTADYLGDILNDRSVIGLGWGRTLDEVSKAVEKKRMDIRGAKVVSLIGGMSANTNQPNPYDVASHLASAIGAVPHYLLLPAIVDNPRIKKLLLKSENNHSVTSLWDKLTVNLFSIGRLLPETGLFYSFPSPKKACSAVKKQGGIGDLLARPFDKDGKFLATDFLNRIIAIDNKKLKNVKTSIGVAGGEEKADAILGALRTGLLTVLITDESAGRKILAKVGTETKK
ncbi:MAG: hypothetical protein HQK83_10970 [Fibrobacteria bacterium]|nr:hypothetical protein [Fibrobacteria bacterium]